MSRLSVHHRLATVIISAALFGCQFADAASGTWTGADNVMWTNSANWSVSPYAGSNTNEKATFDSSGNGNTALNIAGLYSIGSMTFDTANVAAYTIGTGGPNGQTLVMGGSGLYYLSSAAGHSQVLNVTLQLGGSAAAGSYFFRNENTAETLTFAGNVVSGTGSTPGTKTMSAYGAGSIVFSGNLDKGTASALVVTNGLTGTLTLSGSNTLTTLCMTGSSNTVTDIGSGSLSLSNLGSNVLYSTQGGTINGTGKIRLSTASGDNPGDAYIATGKTLVINPALTGNAGFEMNSGAGTFVLEGLNDFTGNVYLNSAGTLSVDKIGNRNATDSNLGAGTTVNFVTSNARLLYTGVGETSDRLFAITNSTTTAIIEHAGSGYLKLTGDVVPTLGGNKQLKLQGSTSATGEVAGVFSDYASTNTVYKNGTGTWKLSGNNTFKGMVEINQGILLITQSGALGIGPKTVKITNGTAGNPQLHLDGSAGSIVLETNLTFSTSNNTDGSIHNIAGTNTIKGDFAVTGGGGATIIHSRAGKITLCGSFTPDQTSRIIYLRGNGDGEISGFIQNGTTVNLPLIKEAGTGTWTLSGPNTYSGSTTISSGTLALSGANGTINASTNISIASGATLLLNNTAAANHANRLNNATLLTLTGGTLAFVNDGGAANFSESAGALVLSSGQNTIAASQAALDQTSTLTFASLTRSGTATLNFTGIGIGESDRNRIFINGQPDGLIGTWATINGTGYACYDSVKGVTAISADIAARGPDSTIVSNATSVVRISTPGTAGNIELSDPTTVIDTLVQDAATPATVNTASKYLLTKNIIINADKEALSIGAAPNDGTLATSVAGGNLTLSNFSISNLTVNAVITDNTAPSSLTKSGNGTLVLKGSNTFSGSVSVLQGEVSLANSFALQNVMLGSLSGIDFDSSVPNHAFTLGNITNSFALALADNAANPVALSVGNNNASSSFGGVISGTGSLNKVGTGKLTLTATSTFNGGLKVSQGTLATGLAGGLGTGPVTNDATLNLTAGNVTYTALGTSLAGAGTVNVTLGTGSNNNGLNGDYSAFTGVWNLGVNGTGGRAQMNGADNVAATVNVLSNATVLVNAAVTRNAAAILYGGDTGESYGQLRLEANAVWAGPVTLAGNISSASDGIMGGNSGTGTVSGVISDANGPHPVAKIGGGVLCLTGTNTYAGDTWVRAGTLVAASLRNVGQPSSLGQPANATDGTIRLGTGSTSARLTYAGTGDTTDRILDMTGTTGTPYLEQAGSGVVKFTSGMTVSGVGSKTLTLHGSTLGTGELAGIISNGVGSVISLSKSGSGRWVLSGANTYTGDTSVTDGTLVLAHPNAVSYASMIKFTGYGGVLELASSGVAETTNNITIGVGNAGTLASGVPSGSVGMNHNVGFLTLSSVTLNVARASSVISGSPSITADALNLSAGSASTATLNPTTADLLLGRTAILSGSYAKTLRLDGTSTGNKVTGSIYTSLNTLSLSKDNTSVWTLTGSNTYNGATTVNNGYLVVAEADGSIASSNGVTLNAGGTLRLSNTPTWNHANRLRDATAITMNGGTLDFSHTGGSANYSETIGATTLNSAGNTVSVSQAASGQTSALTLTSLTRSANGTIAFTGTGIGQSDRNRIFITGQPDGVIGFWATCNGVAPALYSSTLGVNDGASAFTDTQIAAKGPSSTIPDNASANVRITTAGSSGPIALAVAPVTRVALLQQSTATAATVDMAGKTLRAYAVAINAGQESLTLGQAAGDGALTALADGGKVELVNDSTNTLTVNASVANNAGTVSLAKNGDGDVVLNGACTYSGDTIIGAGSLTYGSSATQSLSGVISGSGALIKSGTNVLTLAGKNTYVGITYINQGIVLAQTNQAFGATTAGTVIAPGATLDVGANRAANNLNISGEALTVSGAGVDGKGALVNNSATSQYSALGAVTMVGDTTVGGAQSGGRLDIRSSPTLTMNGYTLTKVGPNTFGITSATVTPGTGRIDVTQGTLRFESNTKMNGSETNTLTVRNGATLELYQHYPLNATAWGLVLDDGATLSATAGIGSSNTWAGPVTLNGVARFTGSGSYTHTINGVISGSGSILKYGASTTYLTNDVNTYSGFTWITNGTLFANSIRNIGVPCSSLGAPATPDAGTIKLGNATLGYTGTGDTTDRILDLTASATLSHVGTGLLKFTGGTTASVAGAKTLTLSSSLGGNGEFACPLTNAASSRLAITKTGTGTWTLSGNNAYTGDVNIAAGTLTLSGANAQGLGTMTVGSAAGSAVLKLTSGSALSGKLGILVGYISGSHAALYMTGGTVLRTPVIGNDLAFTFGRTANAYGYFNMSGGDMNITRIQTGASSSGANAIGVVRMTGGTLTLPDYLLLARGVGTLSAFTFDGGTINHTNAGNNLSLGYEGGRAELNLTGGTLESYGKNLTIRQSASNPTGIVNLCAGMLSIDAIQNTSPGVGLLNFMGGTLKAGSNTTAFIPATMTGVYSYGPFGSYAGGAVIDTLNKTNTVAASIKAPAGNGVYAITLSDKGSGYIGEPYVSIDSVEGLGATAVANMEDDGSGSGTYRVASVTITCPGVNYVTLPTVLFKGGGAAAVAPTVADVTLSPNSSGGLTKQGAGSLTLGAANTYSGVTTVTGGTLKLGVANALLPNAQITLAGGTLDLNGFTITNSVSGTGAITNGTLQSVLSPAGEGVIGTDTLTLKSATMAGLYRADVTTAGASDCVAVQGNINLANFILQIVDTDQLDRRQTYTILTCTGTRTGTFSSTNIPDSRWHVLYGVDGTVKLFHTTGTLIRLR